MNEGVQILIERMKTHPEEFVPEYDGGVTKWGNAIGQYRTYLTAEDNKALDDAWKETVVIAMQEKFTQRVMEELVDPKSQTPSDIELKRGMLSGGQTHAQQMAIQQAYLAQQQQATQAHIQLHQQQLAQGSNAYNNLGSATQGYLSSLFGGKK